MRLKTLTNLSTCLLLGVCLTLAVTLWWSQQALERPFQTMERYLTLSQQVQHQVVGKIFGYLDSGDALLHAEAVQALDGLEQTLDELSPELADTARPSLAALNAFSTNELLAAGKLAGDPQALLLQAEREISDVLEQLSRYATESQNPEASAYREPLFQASQRLLKLGQARSRMISSGNPALADDIERELDGIRQQATNIDALPLLGVADESTSGASAFANLLGLDNSASETQAEDRATGLRRELNSLLQRYPGELNRTREQIASRKALYEATRQQTGNLQEALDRLEPLVLAEHGRIQSEVRLLLGLVIALIVLIALGIDRIQRGLTRLLGQLQPALSAWAAGDFTKAVALKTRNQEMVDLQDSLNRLRDYLSSLVANIRQQAERMSGSSQTLAQLSSGLHQGAERQAGDTALIRDALGELEATILQVSEDAGRTAESSRDAGRSVEQGQQVIEGSLLGMQKLVSEVRNNAGEIERLAEESNTIGDVLTVIRSIAEQTNLLALNAAIEAARAGEQGRGFAVVADEVRTLAQRSAQATDEIQQVINRLQSAATRSLDAMRSQVSQAQSTAQQAQAADGALVDVVDAIRAMAENAERIAAATAQQTAAVSEIRDHSERIHNLGETNLSLIDGGRQEGERLLNLGSELQVAVSTFRVG
ncbi:methyl-accepting chemotaxis protein CtpL [Pseudomonas matsuisoli]|uniref:Methyl-accepting chemotaxis protein CtpL n=1 Tax=Pseudomonas matsuisoli TaxID=1515666 RepID=A0A917PXV7_9PSED|nr:methyl-accepting chemotaxis protein [Pseudomonas matsuisoli]GGJ97784.1 methyl-accepting chemotaxis protein CtpL [Pseudomonas matsuisoli]